MENQDILKAIEEEKAKAAAAKAERDAQLQMLLDRPTTLDTRAAAGFIDQMYGSNTMAGAKAAAEQAAQEQDLLQTLLKEERTPSSSVGLSTAKLLAQDALNKEKLELAKAGLELKKDTLAAKVATAPTKLTKGQEAVDRTFAKTYEDFYASGGIAGIQRSLGALEDAKAALAKGKGLTGPAVGVIPKGVRDVINPESSAIQEQVEQVVQSSLRQTLGAQFTEKEGQMVIKRAYNPALSEAENIKRIDAVKKEIEGIAAAKAAAAAYFEENGTLAGYKGPRVEDLKNKLLNEPKGAPVSDARQKLLEQLRGKK